MAPVESRTETFDKATHRQVEVKQFFKVDSQPVAIADNVIAEACTHGANSFKTVYQIAAIKEPSVQDGTTTVTTIAKETAREIFKKIGLLDEALATELFNELGSRPFSCFGARINSKIFLFVLERPETPQNASTPYHLKAVHCA